MDSKTLTTLEFNKIIQKLADFAVNDAAKKKALEIFPLNKLDLVEEELNKTDSAYLLLLRYSCPQITRIKDIKNSVKRINAGGILSASEILNIAEILKGAEILKKYHEEKDDVLNIYFDSLYTDSALVKNISSCIISEEEIADNASSELYSIRKKIRSASVKIKNFLNEMARSEKYKKYLQEQIVSVKNGRYVLPVKAEYKNEVPGIVHDISASGGTLFVEPQFSVSENNILNELSIKEKREIERILAELTQAIALITDELSESFDLICDIDLLFAKAKLAHEYKASKPLMNNEGIVEIRNGRHPLIDKDKVVPENISLGTYFDSLVVTGPNTGGKTVVLKTIGLFSLMAQAGLLVPADDGTRLCVFENIFADIGDEQSIEQSLSTFSSHMKNIVGILEKITPDTLVLFDELGAGTDPTEGAALACSILEYVKNIGAKTVATTHYSELKLYALSTKRVENASLEFDVDTLSPTYRLLIGIPGKSNAFAISKRLGLSDYIIDKAKEKLSEENIKFEDVLAGIEKDRRIAEHSRIEQEKLESELERLKEELALQKEKIEIKKEKIISSANKEAQEIIENARTETEKLIERVKNSIKKREDKDALKAMEEVRKELGVKLKTVKTAPDKSSSKKTNATVNTLKPGAPVLIVDLNDKGTVISINKKDETAVVQMGIMKTVSKISNLVILEDETAKNIEKFIPKHRSEKQIASVKTEIDVRGMNLEEALQEVDKFLDVSAMNNLLNVTVIHGKGSGVLGKGLHAMLRKNPHVKSYRFGRYGEGENGVTIIELK